MEYGGRGSRGETMDMTTSLEVRDMNSCRHCVPDVRRQDSAWVHSPYVVASLARSYIYPS